MSRELLIGALFRGKMLDPLDRLTLAGTSIWVISTCARSEKGAGSFTPSVLLADPSIAERLVEAMVIRYLGRYELERLMVTQSVRDRPSLRRQVLESSRFFDPCAAGELALAPVRVRRTSTIANPSHERAATAARSQIRDRLVAAALAAASLLNLVPRCNR